MRALLRGVVLRLFSNVSELIETQFHVAVGECFCETPPGQKHGLENGHCFRQAPSCSDMQVQAVRLLAPITDAANKLGRVGMSLGQ
jgi:hypothetical protein